MLADFNIDRALMNNLRALSLSERWDIAITLLNDVQQSNGGTFSPTVSTLSATQQNTGAEDVLYIDEMVLIKDSVNEDSHTKLPDLRVELLRRKRARCGTRDKKRLWYRCRKLDHLAASTLKK